MRATTQNNCSLLWVSGPHLKFEDEVEALQVVVKELETLGYNKIIALGHSGFDVDKDIAKRVRGVDVVIGGHTNTFLYSGIFNVFNSSVFSNKLKCLWFYKMLFLFYSKSKTLLTLNHNMKEEAVHYKPQHYHSLQGSLHLMRYQRVLTLLW